jgi:hypothetical protein
MSDDRTVNAWLEQWDTAAYEGALEPALLTAGMASQANASNRLPIAAWRVALDQLTAGSTIASRYVLPVYDGDRDELTDEQISEADRSHVEFRLGRRDALARALCGREESTRGHIRRIPWKDAIRDTHRAVHRALAGDDTSGCRWCARSER